MSRERRHFSRVNFESIVTIETRHRRYQADLLDISLKGALVSIPGENTLQRHQACTFELRLDQGSAAVRMDAGVVYVKDNMLGLQFEHPDLESITHLRRLVELNTGDSALVRNELFFLSGTKPEG